jgi:hypothetical protein
MNCVQYRRSLLADPQHRDTDKRRHAQGCPECARYTEQIRAFESRLQHALRVSVDPRSGSRGGRPTARVGPVRWLTMAASVAAAAVIVGSLWLAASERSLAAAVVGHMPEEPQAWSNTDRPVAALKLEAVLRDAHLRLKADAGLVTYASSCSFRGHQVPHLVVETRVGPVTVMMLTHETALTAMHFDESGYQGMIIPMPHHGSMAVLERGAAIDMQTVESVASQVENALDWTA